MLYPISTIILQGNQAQQWLQQHQQGLSITTEIIQNAIATVNLEEKDLEDKLCEQVLIA